MATQSLTDRVNILRESADGFTPAVVEALRLADAYADFEAEAYSLPTSQAFGAFQPNTSNAMLYGAAPALAE